MNSKSANVEMWEFITSMVLSYYYVLQWHYHTEIRTLHVYTHLATLRHLYSIHIISFSD